MNELELQRAVHRSSGTMMQGIKSNGAIFVYCSPASCLLDALLMHSCQFTRVESLLSDPMSPHTAGKQWAMQPTKTLAYILMCTQESSRGTVLFTHFLFFFFFILKWLQSPVTDTQGAARLCRVSITHL